TLRADYDGLKGQLDGAHSENERLTAELATLRAGAGDYSTLRADYDGLLAENARLKGDLDGTKQEFGDWRMWLTGLMGAGAAGMALSQADARAKYDDMQAELNSLRARSGEYDGLKANFATTQQNLTLVERDAKLWKRSGVVITYLEFDPPGKDIDGEYVTIRNGTARPVDMTGWKLHDDNNKHVYTFPAFTLGAGEEVQLWSKKGENDGTNLYWGNTGAIWNNTGDTALLLDDEGNEISRYSYDGKTAKKSPLTLALGENEKLKAEVTTLRAKSDEDATLRNDYDMLKANFATVQANFAAVQSDLSAAQREAKLWKRSGVVVTYVEFDPPGKDIDGEYVLIHNGTLRSVDMTGWKLRDDNNKHVYTFPAFTLGAGDDVQLWSKKGENDAANLYWGNWGAIWNNTGDTALLLDDEGNEISRYSYDGKTASTSPLARSMSMGNKLQADMATLRVKADEGSRLRAEYDRLKADYATTQQNLTAAQREAKLWKRSGVVITYLEFDPPGKDIDGEYVTIRNGTSRAVDMTGWKLRDDNNKHVYTFPAFTLGAGEEVQLWSKKGENDGANLYWGNWGAIWNNTGDTALLLDDEGNEISRYSYDGKTAKKSPLTLALGENEKLKAELAALAADLSKVRGNRRDPLRDVNGIGPVYEKRLFEAGVTTFERLSQLKPDEIKAIIKPQDWQALDFDAWIAEARQFAEQVKAGTYQSSS
nr:lamin tail domain-containing protein [Chloroflexaceae bacterium]